MAIRTCQGRLEEVIVSGGGQLPAVRCPRCDAQGAEPEPDPLFRGKLLFWIPVLPLVWLDLWSKSAAFAALSAAVLSVVPARLTAEDFNQIGRLQIVHSRAHPAAVGESTRLHMKIVNDGFDDLHVVKLTSPVATNVRISLIAPHGRSVPLNSITVTAHEIIDLGTSHFRVVLDGLSRDLRAGENFSLTLHIAPYGTITTSVTVGDVADGGAS